MKNDMTEPSPEKGRGLFASLRRAVGQWLPAREQDGGAMETWLVVGLGNPGTKYAHTRHNVGFDVLEVLEKRWNATNWRTKLKGEVAEVSRGDKRVVLCRPQTFMNASGECVTELLRWYKVPPERLMVIYDDIDLPSAKLRVRKSGSAGTHNGMRSIIGLTGEQNFPRIRVGTGKCPDDWQLVDWVLSHYLTREEQAAMDAAFAKAADCVEDWVDNGIDHAMQLGNNGK